MLTQKQFDDLVRRYIQGDLDTAGERALTREVQANPERRRELQALLRVDDLISQVYQEERDTINQRLDGIEERSGRYADIGELFAKYK